MGPIAKDVADADLAQLLTDLRDADACARALAALCVLLPRLPPEQLSAVEGELPTLVELLASDQPTVQSNATAALTALASQDEDIAARVAQLASAPFAELLQSSAGAAGQQGSLLLNVLAALAMLAREAGPAASELLKPEVLATVLSTASPQQPPHLQEVAVDALCALASQGSEQQEQLLAAGALEAAASLFAAPSPDVQVRALMCAAMLATPERPAALPVLAHVPGALAQLLALMRQSEDVDCRVIARDLLAVLRSDGAVKAQIEAAVRGGARVGVAAPV